MLYIKLKEIIYFKIWKKKYYIQIRILENTLLLNIFSQVFFECECFPYPFMDIYEIFTSWSQHP